MTVAPFERRWKSEVGNQESSDCHRNFEYRSRIVETFNTVRLELRHPASELDKLVTNYGRPLND